MFSVHEKFFHCAPRRLCTAFYVSLCKPFRNSLNPYLPHTLPFVMPSLQIYHPFPLVLCTFRVCSCIFLWLSSPSIRLQFYSSHVQQSNAQCPLTPFSPLRRHQLQFIPPPWKHQLHICRNGFCIGRSSLQHPLCCRVSNISSAVLSSVLEIIRSPETFQEIVSFLQKW